MSGKRALVTGVGPSTGLAIVQRLVKGGYQVGMLARNEERLRGFESIQPGTRAFVVDVTDTAWFAETLHLRASQRPRWAEKCAR